MDVTQANGNQMLGTNAANGSGGSRGAGVVG